jgi:GntR family transcriptional regulator / MocR family aminotransferase
LLRSEDRLSFVGLRLLIYVRLARGVHATVPQVFIVSGTQQALDLTARMLIDRGDRVVVEDPAYQAARQVFQGYGARVSPVPVDQDGLVVQKLPKAAVRLAYVTPSHHFPLGGVLPRDRRLELLAWAERSGAYVLEDDYDSEFRYDAKPVEALQGLDQSGRVLYIGSFSKVLFPSLRIGYLIVPEELVPVVAAMKFLSDVMAPVFEQEVLADFLVAGHFERHIHRMRVLYASRRRVLLEALREAFGGRLEVFGAEAGLHVVVSLRGLGLDEVPALLARAAGAGVGVYSAAPYYQKAPQRAELILGYAGLSERELRAGVRAFAEVVALGAKARAGDDAIAVGEVDGAAARPEGGDAVGAVAAAAAGGSPGGEGARAVLNRPRV